jgi:hypothetical protein
MIQLRQIRAQELSLMGQDAYSRLRQALVRVLAYSSGYTPEWVFRKAHSGDILLLVILRGINRVINKVINNPQEMEEVGFVIAQIDTHNNMPALYLFGVEVEDSARFSIADYRDLSRVLTLLAVHKGCCVVRAKSPRPGWSRVAERLGFVPVATEYERAVVIPVEKPVEVGGDS